MLYAYGLVRPGQPGPDVTGIDGAAVVLVPAGEMAVGVSELPAKVEPTSEHLAQHHRVTLALLAGGGVVPFRFGNVFEAENALRHSLEPRKVELARKLDELCGCVELGLTVRLGQVGPLPPVGAGTRYLLAKRRQLGLADELRAHVGHLVKDWRQDLQGAALNVACLVPQDCLPELRSRLATFQPRPKVSGPWAPSSFV